MSETPEPPEDPEESAEEQQRRKVRLNVEDELKHGVYANFLIVSHSPHEFTLDFCQLLPADGSGQVRADVVSRVKIPPTVVGKVIRALNTNLNNYEDKYGNVKEIG
jgi:hypothetical protein